jgi:CTP:molybdopterin cytidylyltransferase MocA
MSRNTSPNSYTRSVIILAAGKGTRMKSDLPKVMHPAAGRPMVESVVDAARAVGCSPVVLVIGHGADVVRAHFAGHANTEFVMQMPQLGTGHAVDMARPLFERGALGEETLVLCGDGPLIRPHTLQVLLDTHRSSGLGIASCASCHIDARMDQLAWDLGDPTGSMRAFDQDCNLGGEGCDGWHPMKGPLVTQTLLGLAGDAPFHWRGDRASLAEFGHAANTLLSNPEDFNPEEMAQLEAYLASISRMPNPNRNLDGSLGDSVMGGNAAAGRELFLGGVLAGGADCALCHANAKGGGASVLSPAFAQQPQNVTNFVFGGLEHQAMVSDPLVVDTLAEIIRSLG